MYEWRTGRGCVFKNNLHLVFVTKYRRNVFTQEMLARIKELFAQTCMQMDVELIEFGGEDDHVHILVTVPPKLAVSILVGKLKGKSSYFLRKEFGPQIKQKLWGKHLWSPSYCVVSCGGAPLDIVKEYVKNQRKPPSKRQVHQSKVISSKARCALDSPLK
jgi:putative transposase